MIILLNVGNTHTQIGSLDPSGQVELLRVVATNQLNVADFNPADLIVGVSVVPEVKLRLQTLKIHWFDANMPTPLIIKIDPSTFGADRLANAVQAQKLYSNENIIVADCGTAITFEVVNSSGELLGGAILPGRKLLSRALALAAQLPEIPLSSQSTSGIGENTSKAMHIGIEQGVLGAAQRVFENISQSLTGSVRLLITGGDADFFREIWPQAEYMPATFTLEGVAQLCRYNKLIQDF